MLIQPPPSKNEGTWLRLSCFNRKRISLFPTRLISSIGTTNAPSSRTASPICNSLGQYVAMLIHLAPYYQTTYLAQHIQSYRKPTFTSERNTGSSMDEASVRYTNAVLIDDEQRTLWEFFFLLHADGMV